MAIGKRIIETAMENLPLLLHQARALPNLDWPVLLITFLSLLVSHPRDNSPST